jgi:hypothetical protein
MSKYDAAVAGSTKRPIDKGAYRAVKFTRKGNLLKIKTGDLVVESKEQTPSDILVNLVSENARLREKLRKANSRPSRAIADGLLGIGAFLLVLSYLYSSTIATLIGLGLILWGSILILSVPRKLLSGELAALMTVSDVSSLGQLLSGLGYRGKAIFLPLTSIRDLKDPKVFIPKVAGTRSSPKLEDSGEQILFEKPEGVVLVGIGSGLAVELEREMGRTAAILDFDYVNINLPKVLTAAFGLFNSVDIDREEDGRVHFAMKGQLGSEICEKIREVPNVHELVGCPICSSVGTILSHAFNKPVILSESRLRGSTIESYYEIIERD